MKKVLEFALYLLLAVALLSAIDSLTLPSQVTYERNVCVPYSVTRWGGATGVLSYDINDKLVSKGDCLTDECRNRYCR